MTTRVHTPPHRDTTWMERAACRGTALRKFYPGPGNNQVGPGKQVCTACPVRDDCLEYDMALDPGDMHGIWGGLSYLERRSLHRARMVSRGTSPALSTSK